MGTVDTDGSAFAGKTAYSQLVKILVGLEVGQVWHGEAGEVTDKQRANAVTNARKLVPDARFKTCRSADGCSHVMRIK